MFGMDGLFDLLAGPLGLVMHWVYRAVDDLNFMPYFLTLLIFTFLVRLLMFPLSIGNQKNQRDRARLAPKLERIQKKYGKDQQKMLQKQQELYEKEGVKMTAGCLPMIVQMLLLFSVLSVIYKPLTHIQQIPAEQIDACRTAVLSVEKEKLSKNEYTTLENSLSKGYYAEMNLMGKMESHEKVMKSALKTECKLTDEQIAKTWQKMEDTKKDFTFINGRSLLDKPSSPLDFFKNYEFDWLWLIVLLSGVSSLITSLVSTHYSKAAMSQQQQQMGGCSTNAMMYMMPVMSLYFCFMVPAGVAIYWTFSNLFAILQTVILNAMYSPAKARAQAEAEYESRRQQKREDRERLKEARLAEQAAWQEEEKQAKARAKGDITQKKSAVTTATPAELPKEKVDEIPKEPVNSEEDN